MWSSAGFASRARRLARVAVLGLATPALLQLVAVETARAQEPAAPSRRALLVGIDDYTRGGSATGRWRDLQGAKNDVAALERLLVENLGFETTDIVSLVDAEASRAEILAQMNEVLVEPSRPGDLALFYFAGHGSQSPSQSDAEIDRLDETIVPADSALGARDIRDKELRRIFNDAIDRGAELVVVIDSCHSGGATRGGAADRGPASARGMRALRPDPATPVGYVETIEDDVRGAPEDRGAVIFGAARPGTVAAEVDASRGQRRGAFSAILFGVLKSRGGAATPMEIHTRTRLALERLDTHRQTPLLLTTASRRKQPLFAGPRTSDESPVPARDETSIAVVESLPNGRILADAGRASGLREGAILRERDGPRRFRVDRLVGIDRSEATATTEPQDAGEIGRALRPGDLLEIERPSADAWGELALGIPGPGSPPEVARALELHIREIADLRVVDASAAELALRTSRRGDARFLHWEKQTGAREHLAPRSRAVRVDEGDPEGVARTLLEIASTMQASARWLEMPAGDDARFPLQLGLLRDGRLLAGGVVREGDVLQVVLRSPVTEGREIEPRYVYVFAIDPYGEAAPVFPTVESWNVENRLPLTTATTEARLLPLGSEVTVDGPFGTEYVFLVSSESPIPDPTRLHAFASSRAPLARIEGASVARRVGQGTATPATFGVQRLRLTSLPRPERP